MGYNEVMEAVTSNLRQHVNALCNEIGPRSFYDPEALQKAAQYIEQALAAYGYDVERHEYTWRGRGFCNLVVELTGKTHPEEIVIVGAHYDTVHGTVGADDNTSAVAGLLELARLFQKVQPERTLRFVCFTLEEPPAFLTSGQGSRVYARRLRRQGEQVVAMLSLEMLGYYSDKPNSQHFPFFAMRWFYPTEGNFIGVVANLRSRDLMVRVREAMRRGCNLPVESLSAPALVPGVSLSDHASFWSQGYRAVMITDTAFYRNPHYHRPSDRPETLDFPRMAECVRGLHRAIAELAGLLKAKSPL
jgi:Zn-dependent M28 family amino/carboxypeptidase